MEWKDIEETGRNGRMKVEVEVEERRSDEVKEEEEEEEAARWSEAGSSRPSQSPDTQARHTGRSSLVPRSPQSSSFEAD